MKTPLFKHKFPYKWNLSDGFPAKGIDQHNKKVFGTFICGGGSSMGYKLAGFKHLGGVEIDPKVADIYKTNHNPKHFYIEDLRLFNKRENLPEELYNLDLLDGSPPCSSFSMAGSREKGWGKNKKFREGQTKQVLDDLVYVYIDTIAKLKPKVAILENVKGLIQGNAKSYAKKIKSKFENLGYRVQVFLLNAASMGVPQRRERVFFIGLRNDIKLPILKFSFNERSILFGEIARQTKHEQHKKLTKAFYNLWIKIKEGRPLSDADPNGNRFSSWKLSMGKCMPTLTSTAGTCNHYSRSDMPYYTNENEWRMCGTYPMDYLCKDLDIKYLIGMSVPPVMTAQISHQIYLQWLSKI